MLLLNRAKNNISTAAGHGDGPHKILAPLSFVFDWSCPKY